MKEAIKLSVVLAAAVLLAACARKEETVMPEPAAEAPVEMAAPEPTPFESAPVEAAPADAAPMGEGAATDAMTVPADDAAAAAEELDTERAGGDKVAPRATPN